MTKNSTENSVSTAAAGKRLKRRYLPPLIRYPIIAVWGAIVALAVFYLLRKIGF